ncbi:hypothetical protein TNCV_3827591 [Trichonephila clavipes]|nr:hypothetical protein TNCV_3827591 [Trichonephila clavipes]
MVRASDSRPEGLGSMPEASKYPPSTRGNVWKKETLPSRGLDLLQNLYSEINDVPVDDFSDEEVPANYLLECSLDS